MVIYFSHFFYYFILYLFTLLLLYFFEKKTLSSLDCENLWNDFDLSLHDTILVKCRCSRVKVKVIVTVLKKVLLLSVHL